jgi:flagellar biosynthesis chaperone FliJ
MQDIERDDSRWTRRDSKKKAKKNFTSDNRRSVKWLQKRAGEKARDAKRAREQKEKDEWLFNSTKTC